MVATIPRSSRGTPIQVFEIGPTEVVNVIVTTVQSAIYTEDTIVRLLSTFGCHIAVGTNPTATATDMFLPAKESMLVEIKAGDRFAAIRDAQDTNLFITTML